MNPHACRVVLRPRGPLEVFDLGLCFLRVNAAAYGRLAAVLLLPFVPVVVLACWLAEGSPFLALLPVLAAPWLQAPAPLLGGRLLFAERVRVRDVLLECGRRSGPLTAACLLWLLPLPFGCGVLSWVGSIVVNWVTEAAMLEQVSPGRGFKRSSRLSFAHLGVSTASVFGWYGLTAWGAVTGEFVGHACVGTVLQLGEPFGSAFDGRVTPYLLLGMLAVQPLYAIYRLLLYLDVRTRVEGWDLQVSLRAMGLASGAPSGEPT